jgi:hypothetical protein
MLRTLPLADEQILPQAKQESYFFNRIGQKQPLRAGQKRTSDKTPIRFKYDPKW